MAAVGNTKAHEVYRLEIDYNNDGIIFHVGPDATVHEVMEFICSEWLDEMRDGDGGIEDHLWKFRYRDDPPMPFQTNYNDEDAFEAAMDEWMEAQDEREHGIPTSTRIREILGFHVKGEKIHVEYDYGSTTYFDISFVAHESIPADKALPCLVEEEMDDLIPYSPPHGSPNLNDIFPDANKIMFQSGDAKWVCPFPSSISSAGFIEGGFQSHSDIVFMPYKFSSIHEALVGIDIAMQTFPNPKGYSRVVFPMTLDAEAERLYKESEAEVKEFLEFKRNHNVMDYFGRNFARQSELSANIQRRLWISDVEVHARVTETVLKSYQDVICQMFPLSARAYENGLWASYRRGKVIVSKTKNSREEPNKRGVPDTVLAKRASSISSLHDFFCVCEALFQQLEATKTFESMQEILRTDAAMLAAP